MGGVWADPAWWGGFRYLQEKDKEAHPSLPGSWVADLYPSVTASIFQLIGLFLPLVCIYLWPLYLLAAAQARHGQLRPGMGSSPRHLFLHHSRSPWVIYLLSASSCSINTRGAGHWEKHLAFCTQIVPTPGPANPGQTPATNISPAVPSTSALLFSRK